jgi:arylsulfatase A-like enzyme
MLNFLVLCIDCLRYDRFTALVERKESRLAAAIAARGCSFSRAYTAAPWTYPATNSVLTGLLPSKHGARHSGSYRRGVDSPWPELLDPGCPTFFSLLRGAGHATIGISTIYWALNERCDYQGCDVIVRSSEQNIFYKQTPAEWVRSRFLEFFQARPKDQPFAAYLHFMDLHRPYQLDIARQLLPDSMVIPLGVEEWDIRPYLSSPERASRFRQAKLAVYDALLLYIDSEIGLLLDFLEAENQLNQTVLVLLGDHGEEFWEHAEFESRHYDCGKKSSQDWLLGTGHGHTLFDEILHVPLVILNPPEPIHAASIARNVSTLDVLPTILEWQGARIPAGLDGCSLTQALPERTLFAEATLYGFERKAAIRGNLKCIASPGDRVLTLFEIGIDPREQHPLPVDLEPLLAAELLERFRGEELS